MSQKNSRINHSKSCSAEVLELPFSEVGGNTNGNIRDLLGLLPAGSTPREGCTSIYRGVSMRKGRNRWRVDISKGSRSNGTFQYVRLGEFKIETDAALAYDAAAIKLRGPDTWTNTKHFGL